MKCSICGREMHNWADGVDICPECYAKRNFRAFWHGIPRQKSVNIFYNEKAGRLFEDAEAFYNAYGNGRAYIYGSTGAGKTVLAVNLLVAQRLLSFENAFEKQRQHTFNPYWFTEVGLFISCPQLEFFIKTNISEAGSKLDDVAYVTPLLVLDDFGRGFRQKSDFVMDFWFSLLDVRERNHMKTVFTSEKSLDDLRDILGEAIPSRIYSIVEGNVFLKKGEDIRLKRYSNNKEAL